MIEFLQKYLQINTAHPNPAYDQALALLVKQATADGLQTRIVPLPSGFKAFIATLPGRDTTLPSLALNHHMDVVSAPEPEQWLFPPFSGHRANDTIFGRGTQDMKGVGVVQYWALKKIIDQNISLERTIHFIALPDEEMGGYKGAGQFVQTKEFRDLNIGFVLDEGLSSGDPHKLYIKVSERKPMQIRFTSKGDMVHGSRMDCTNAIHELIRALETLVQFQEDQKKKLETQAAGLMLSMNITSFSAGIINDGKTTNNVVPPTASATMDIRIPPTMAMMDAQKKIDAVLKDFPGISYFIESKSYETMSLPASETTFFKSLHNSIAKHGLKVEKLYAEEASAMRFYLTHDGVIHGLGITPFRGRENIHQVNECVSVSDLELGRDIFYDFIKEFCIAKELIHRATSSALSF